MTVIFKATHQSNLWIWLNGSLWSLSCEIIIQREWNLVLTIGATFFGNVTFHEILSMGVRQLTRVRLPVNQLSYIIWNLSCLYKTSVHDNTQSANRLTFQKGSGRLNCKIHKRLFLLQAWQEGNTGPSWFTSKRWVTVARRRAHGQCWGCPVPSLRAPKLTPCPPYFSVLRRPRYKCTLSRLL